MASQHSYSEPQARALRDRNAAGQSIDAATRRCSRSIFASRRTARRRTRRPRRTPRRLVAVRWSNRSCISAIGSGSVPRERASSSTDFSGRRLSSYVAPQHFRHLKGDSGPALKMSRHRRPHPGHTHHQRQPARRCRVRTTSSVTSVHVPSVHPKRRLTVHRGSGGANGTRRIVNVRPRAMSAVIRTRASSETRGRSANYLSPQKPNNVHFTGDRVEMTLALGDIRAVGPQELKPLCLRLPEELRR